MLAAFFIPISIAVWFPCILELNERVKILVLFTLTEQLVSTMLVELILCLLQKSQFDVFN